MPYDKWLGQREDGAYGFGDSATGESIYTPPTADAELHRARITGEPLLAENSAPNNEAANVYPGLNYSVPDAEPPRVSASRLDASPAPMFGAPAQDPAIDALPAPSAPASPAPPGATSAPGTSPQEEAFNAYKAGGGKPPAVNVPPDDIRYNTDGAARPGQGAAPDLHGVAAQAYIDAAFARGGGATKGGKFQTAETQQIGPSMPTEYEAPLATDRKEAALASMGREDLENDREAQRLEQKAALDYEFERQSRVRQQQAEAEVAELSRQAKEIASEEPGKADPGRWWKSKSTEDKAVAFMWGILGGVAQGLGKNRGPNQAWQEMDRQRDEDIKAQYEDLKQMKDRREKRLTSVQQMLVLAKEQGASDAEAIRYAKMAANESLIAQMRAEALKTGSPIAQARAEETIAKIRAQDSEFAAQNARDRVGTIQKQYVVKQASAGGGISPQKRAELLEKAAEAYAKGGAGSDQRPVFVLPNGQAVPAQKGVSKETVDKGNDLIGKVMVLEDAAKKGQDVGYVFSEKEATIIADTMGNTQSQVTGGGVPAEETRKAWVKGLQSPVEKQAILAEANRIAKSANSTVLRYTDPNAAPGAAPQRMPVRVPGMGEMGTQTPTKGHGKR